MPPVAAAAFLSFSTRTMAKSNFWFAMLFDLSASVAGERRNAEDDGGVLGSFLLMASTILALSNEPIATRGKSTFLGELHCDF